MKIFSLFLYQVLSSIFKRAFKALSFDPSNLEHKIFDLISIWAKIEQFFLAFSILVERVNYQAIRAKFWAILCLFSISTLLYSLWHFFLLLKSQIKRPNLIKNKINVYTLKVDSIMIVIIWLTESKFNHEFVITCR